MDRHPKESSPPILEINDE